MTETSVRFQGKSTIDRRMWHVVPKITECQPIFIISSILQLELHDTYIYIYIHSISLRICTMYQYTCILYIYNVWVTLIVISLFCCQCLWGLGTPLAPPWHPLGTPLAPPWHPLGTQPFSRCGPGQLFRHVLGFLLGDSLRLHLGRRDQAEISLGSHEHPS